MDGRLVTVFGGGGFVGRYAAQALLAKGYRVRVAQRDPRQAWFLKPQGGLGQTQFVGADIGRYDTVARAVEGSSAVINLVGIMKGALERMHVTGAGHIARAAAAAGADSLVHISAIGADAGSLSAYGRSKGEGEAAVRAAFPAATILRPSVVFGPEDDFVNRFAAMIVKAPVVPVLRARTRFQPVFVADVAAAITAAITGAVAAPDPQPGRTLALGGPDILTMEALIRYIARTIGRDPSIVALPDMLGAAIARAGFLPGAPINWDQWLMLQSDNIVGDEPNGLAALGVVPTPLAAVAPDWLVRFRRQGRFARRVEDIA